MRERHFILFFCSIKIGLFDNLKLEIEDDHLKQLFHDIDIDSNNYIEYNELMNYIR
jgi:Ca2+-binding EF-hand superfamily protein